MKKVIDESTLLIPLSHTNLNIFQQLYEGTTAMAVIILETERMIQIILTFVNL